MCKKIFLIGVLCSFWLLLGSSAMASWPKISGTGLSFGSLNCDSWWEDVGNTDIRSSEGECELTILQVQVQCRNPGKNTGGLGTPFSPGVTLEHSAVFDEESLVGRGTAFLQIIFEDEELFNAALASAGDSDICKKNWEVVPFEEGGRAVVRVAGLTVKGWRLHKDEWQQTDEVYAECILNTEGTEYSCRMID
jgi:hypothetical protein